MEALFNSFAKHHDSLDEYSSLIGKMYRVLCEDNFKGINKMLETEDLSQIEECCDDLKSIIIANKHYNNFGSFTQYLRDNPLSKNTIDDYRLAFDNMEWAYIRSFYYLNDLPIKKERDRVLICEIKNIIKESIEANPAK